LGEDIGLPSIRLKTPEWQSWNGVTWRTFAGGDDATFRMFKEDAQRSESKRGLDDLAPGPEPVDCLAAPA
jgi:hypothetical protein